MPALNFKKQFAQKVESGEKRQTIRACRKDGRDPKPGQTLYLYTGMRTKQCRKLGEAVCKSVESISINEDGVRLGLIKIGYVLENKVSNDDGFKNFWEMRDFFRETHGLPFTGYLIKW